MYEISTKQDFLNYQDSFYKNSYSTSSKIKKGLLGVKNKALVNAIASGAISIGESISLEQTRKLALLAKELIHWNRQINLTSIRNIDGIVDLHILDSMVIRSFLNGSRILDVGTGAGFRGLPLAIIEPDI